MRASRHAARTTSHYHTDDDRLGKGAEEIAVLPIISEIDGTQ